MARRLSGVKEDLNMVPYLQCTPSNDSKGNIAGRPDLLGCMKQLTTLAQELAGYQAGLAVLNDVAALNRQLHDEYRNHRSQEPQKLSEMMDEISARMEGLSAVLKTQRRGVEMYEAEVKGLVQTVYTMVASQDNRLNYEVARASLRMAEDSNTVAVLARQDSTDMRVIAAATLVFLPGTFVATLFSTGFFNFEPSANDRVSKWLWLYFVLTLALTAIVVLAWRHLSRAETRRPYDCYG